jgi:hypothetical protein
MWVWEVASRCSFSEGIRPDAGFLAARARRAVGGVYVCRRRRGDRPGGGRCTSLPRGGCSTGRPVRAYRFTTAHGRSMLTPDVCSDLRRVLNSLSGADDDWVSFVSLEENARVVRACVHGLRVRACRCRKQRQPMAATATGIPCAT